MTENAKPGENWVEKAVAKIPEADRPKVEEVVDDNLGNEPIALEQSAKPDPAAKSELEADDGDKPDATGKVDIRALHAERGKRKEAERAAREKEIEYARAQERFEILQRAIEEQTRQAQTQAQPQKPEDQAPDINTDPLGHVQWQLEQERRARAALEQQFQQQQGITRQQQQIAQISQTYAAAAQTFASQTPDFKPAYDHLWKELDKDLEDRGVTDPQMRRNMLLQDEMRFAHDLLQSGRNPAEVIYSWAKRRGYQGKAPAPAPQPKNNGLEDAIADIDLQNKRQSASTSLTAAGGKPPSNVTLKDIASMPADEFQNLTKGKNWDKLLRSKAS